jgi:hypothetical protein
MPNLSPTISWLRLCVIGEVEMEAAAQCADGDVNNACTSASATAGATAVAGLTLRSVTPFEVVSVYSIS